MMTSTYTSTTSVEMIFESSEETIERPPEAVCATETLSVKEEDEALIALSALPRDCSWEELSKEVKRVYHSERKDTIPLLIMKMRNHPKSLGPGTGDGEKATPEKILVALHALDAPMAEALLPLMVLFGSFKSLVSILVFTDYLGKAKSVDYHPRNEHEYSHLQADIYRLFADRLSGDARWRGGGVSNASKFTPHEIKSKRTFKTYHGDRIATLLFPTVEDFKMKRKIYRQLRSSLNTCNGHITECYLPNGRAGDLDPKMICAGTYQKMPKAILNITKDNKERYADPGRRALKAKIMEAMKSKPEKIAVPSDIAILAKSLMELSEESDESLRKMLNVCYMRAVDELRAQIKGKVNRAKKLIPALGLSPEAEAEVTALVKSKPIRVVIDCTMSQIRTHPVSCLMAMLYTDVELSEEVPTSAVLFSDTACKVTIPDHNMEPAARLTTMIDACKAQGKNQSGAFGEEFGPASVSNYSAALKLIAQDAEFSDIDILMCSDFADGERLTDALKQWRDSQGPDDDRVISCWRMLDHKGKKRGRAIVWDPSNPKIDVCFVMDTTGSMGTWINYAKQQVQEVVTKLSTNFAMPASSSFVSYKDFEDAGHLEVHPWVDAEDKNGMASLSLFIGELRPTGGGDIPEDMLGAFKCAAKLFADRDQPSIKVVVVIADAPCHGIPGGNGDDHMMWGGVDQAAEMRTQLHDMFVDGGAELMFARCGGGITTTMMCEEFDKILATGRTFMEEFSVVGSSETVFQEKILATLEGCVAQAITPPTELGVDIFSGTDFSVPLSIATSRFADEMTRLSAGLKGEVKEKKSALEQLFAKLDSADYDIVRATMDAVKEGAYAEYSWRKPLSKMSIESLYRAGVTVKDLEEQGYPSSIINQFENHIHSMLAAR